MNLNKATAIEVIAKIFPKIKNITARDCFNEAMLADQPLHLKRHWLVTAQTFLDEAGHNIDSDKPYVEVLKLKGGKKEFDALLPQ